MKDKMIILSWCNADNVINYGQVLQAMAMMMLARSNNAGDIVYISYHPRTIKNKIRCFAERHNPFSGHLIPYLKTKILLNKLSTKHRIKLLQVESYNELEKLSQDCNLMVCGSDQLWHPRNYNPGYYLDFGSESIVRRSYAVSLPKSRIEDRFFDSYKHIEKSIKRLDYISVREKSSLELISSLSGKEVETVLDPTFLIKKETWMSFQEIIDLPLKYIFVYIPNGMDVETERRIDEIKNKTGVKDVVILMTRGDDLFSKYKRIKYVTVGQFLSLINKAEFIFTTSFHAVVFSIIFEKEFSCYNVYNIEQGEDTRFKDILSLLGLEDRQNLDCDTANINYDEVRKILKNEIEKSKEINTTVFSCIGVRDGKR